MKTLKFIEAPKTKNNEPKNRCPECQNDSLVSWVIRLHESNEISDNPEKHVVGSRCEKCSYTVVTAPWIVFHFFKFGLSDQTMLIRAVERCVIDHRKDVIPQEVWNIVLPIIKTDLVDVRVRESAGSNTCNQEFWESFSVICYEAYGKCVWGLD